MAGGEGSRLRPITAGRPKPLVPIVNKPIMEHLLHLTKRHGLTDIVVTLYYLGPEIQSYFGNGEDFDVQIQYSVDDSPLGTAGSVKSAESMVRNDEPFFILSGDALTDCDLTDALRFHKEKGSLATLILTRVPNPLDFGVVITDEEGRIQRFLEKPSWSEVFSDTVNTGMYILEPEIFDLMKEGRPYDWSKDIFPQLLEEGKPMYGYIMDGYWADVGSLAQYRDAQSDLLSGQVDLPISSTEVNDGIYLGEGTNIEDGVRLIPPVFIGNHCKIRGNAQIGPHTVIGDHAFVDEWAVIERSVIWDSVYIGPSVQISAATIGSRVTIKRDAKVLEEAVVGDRCLLDVGCTIKPRVKLWPDKLVERGAVLTMSLIWGNKWSGNLFRDLGAAGISNIEITPDFATRLGSAFGSVLPMHGQVVTSRDSTRSSRMIKRAVIASLLSVGCDVLDLRSTPVPVTRHFIKSSGAIGAINVRKLPTSPRVTLIELFDGSGAYIPKSTERKVENAFFREDFNRIDADDLGSIEFASRATEEYQGGFFHRISTSGGKRKMRIVCDYGFTAMSTILPAMLAHLGVESVSLNAFNNAKSAPRTPEDRASHIANVRHIVTSLGYDMGLLITSEGERLTIVDNLGQVLGGQSFLGVLARLVSMGNENPVIALPVTISSRLESSLLEQGATVVRTKAEIPSLQRMAAESGAFMAGDDSGGIAFPEFHPGFDAAFALGQLIHLLDSQDASISEVLAQLPKFSVAHGAITCASEEKGTLMRKFAKDAQVEASVELTDGLKIYHGDDWVLLLPDSTEPVLHIYAESDSVEKSTELVNRYALEHASFTS